LFIRSLYQNFITPESNGRKIGSFRIVLAILGGFYISYLAIVLLAILIPSSKAQALVVSLYLYTFIWACSILWISLSSSKLIAFMKVFIPTVVFSISIFVLN